MIKTPNVEVVQRINAAQVFLKKYTSTAKVGELLVERYGVSGRQAYRYIVQAQKLKAPLPVPEKKVVFTVKLPLKLVCRLRRLARSRKAALEKVDKNTTNVFITNNIHYTYNVEFGWVGEGAQRGKPGYYPFTKTMNTMRVVLGIF